MKRFKIRELIFLLVPCVAFFAYAYYLSIQPKEPRLVFQRIDVEPSSSPGYDTDVVMHLFAQGPWPRELFYPTLTAVKPGVKNQGYGFAPRCELFYKRNGKQQRFQWPEGDKSILYSANYIGGWRRLVLRCSLNLASVPSELKPLQCRMGLKFYDYQRPNRRELIATAEGFIDLRQ